MHRLPRSTHVILIECRQEVVEDEAVRGRLVSATCRGALELGQLLEMVGVQRQLILTLGARQYSLPETASAQRHINMTCTDTDTEDVTPLEPVVSSSWAGSKC